MPPTVFVSAAPPAGNGPAPAAAAPVAPRRRRRRKPFALVFAILIALGIVTGVTYIVVSSARRSAIERMQNGIKLAHTDSLKAATWVGSLRAGDTYYNLMTFREGEPFVKDFLEAFGKRANVMALLSHNRDGAAHRIELAGATLRFADGTEKPALDSATVLGSALANPDVAVAAFPATIQIPPGEQVWGNLLFIPHDTDIRSLVSVTIKVDGRDGLVQGSFMTAEDKERSALEPMRPKIEGTSTTATTAPATTN